MSSATKHARSNHAISHLARDNGKCDCRPGMSTDCHAVWLLRVNGLGENWKIYKVGILPLQWPFQHFKKCQLQVISIYNTTLSGPSRNDRMFLQRTDRPRRAVDARGRRRGSADHRRRLWLFRLQRAVWPLRKNHSPHHGRGAWHGRKRVLPDRQRLLRPVR